MIQSINEEKRGMPGSIKKKKDHFLTNEVGIQALASPIFLSSTVEVPLFGACIESSREPYM